MARCSRFVVHHCSRLQYGSALCSGRAIDPIPNTSSFAPLLGWFPQGNLVCGASERRSERLPQGVSIVPCHKGHWLTLRVGPHQIAAVRVMRATSTVSSTGTPGLVLWSMPGGAPWLL